MSTPFSLVEDSQRGSGDTSPVTQEPLALAVQWAHRQLPQPIELAPNSSSPEEIQQDAMIHPTLILTRPAHAASRGDSGSMTDAPASVWSSASSFDSIHNSSAPSILNLPASSLTPPTAHQKETGGFFLRGTKSASEDGLAGDDASAWVRLPSPTSSELDHSEAMEGVVVEGSSVLVESDATARTTPSGTTAGDVSSLPSLGTCCLIAPNDVVVFGEDSPSGSLSRNLSYDSVLAAPVEQSLCPLSDPSSPIIHLGQGGENDGEPSTNNSVKEFSTRILSYPPAFENMTGCTQPESSRSPSAVVPGAKAMAVAPPGVLPRTPSLEDVRQPAAAAVALATATPASASKSMLICDDDQ